MPLNTKPTKMRARHYLTQSPRMFYGQNFHLIGHETQANRRENTIGHTQGQDKTSRNPFSVVKRIAVNPPVSTRGASNRTAV